MAESVVGDFVLSSPTGDASTDGLAIDVVATSSPGTIVHTATSGTDYWDYVQVWLVNRDTVARDVVVEWGDTNAKDRITIALAPSIGPVPVFESPRLLRDGRVVRVYCATTGVISAYGEVHTYRGALA